MIVRPGNKQSISFRLPKWLVKTIIIGSIVLILGLIIFILSITRIGTELSQVRNLKEKSSNQENQLDEYNNQLEEIKYEIQSIIEKEQEIRNILNNNSKYRTSSYISPKTKGSQFLAALESETQYTEDPNINIEKSVTFFLAKVKELNSSLDELVTTFRDFREKFAFTPSIWPIYGRIISPYGWRTHPITGEKKFHRGIDIPSWVGAPVRATADGSVRYAGWWGSYGNVVILQHRYGFRTIYAHTSQLLVRTGEKVKKGQVIAQVGSTGLSTGSHLHYEVQLYRKDIAPSPYLDLDMFTAVKNLW